MKDLKPHEPVQLIEMQVPIGRFLKGFCLFALESPDDSAQGVDEEAPPPAAFEYTSWDE
jgi:hypothetical protein